MTLLLHSVGLAPWFQSPATQAVFACLGVEGLDVRAVGGAIRNTLMGYPVNEVDFATTAEPKEVIRLAEIAGFKAVPTGVDHGTVTLVVNKTPFEITTLRRDITTDGRRATVAFGTDWSEDAKRRDFTVNALYADRSGAIYDPLGGYADILARRIRFIGDPEVRLREDYLRILRFFRFSADYADGPFDGAGVLACVRQREGLAKLSSERVRAELVRLLVARRAQDAVQILGETGLLAAILGGVSFRSRFERLCALEAAKVLTPDPILRLAVLAVLIEEDAERLSARLRLSSAESADLKGAVLNASRLPFTFGSGEAARQLYKLGAPQFKSALLYAWVARNIALDAPDWGEALDKASAWQKPKFPLSGGDLVAIGFAAGPKLGEALKSLEELWLNSQFQMSRDALLQAAENLKHTSA